MSIAPPIQGPTLLPTKSPTSPTSDQANIDAFNRVQTQQGTGQQYTAGQGLTPIISSDKGTATLNTAIQEHKADVIKTTPPAPTTDPNKTTTPTKNPAIENAGGITADEAKATGADLNNYVYDSTSGYYVPTTKSKENDINASFTDATKKVDDAFSSIAATLDAPTQNLVNAYKDTYNQRIEEAKKANAQNLQGINTTNMRTGLSRYAPNDARNVLSEAETLGLDNIKKLGIEENQLIAGAQNDLANKKYDLFLKKRDEINNLRTEKVDQITKLHEEATKNLQTLQEHNQKVQDEFTKTKNDAILDARKNGADATTIQNMSNATDIGTLVSSSGDYLQGGTGIIGEYNYYKKDAIARGQTPVDFNTYQNEDANRKARVAAASQDPNRLLTANEAQALGVPFGTTAKDAYGKNPTKTPTENQSKDAAYAQRTFEANQTINTLESTISQYNPVAFLGAVGAENTTIGNVFVPDEIKQIRQAERNFLNAILRRESGAAISATEFDSGNKQYFPRPGDDAKTLAQKKQNRDTQIKNLSKSAGPALVETLGVPSTSDSLQGAKDPMGIL